LTSLPIPGGFEQMSAAALETMLSVVGYNTRVLLLGAVSPALTDALRDRGCTVTLQGAPEQLAARVDVVVIEGLHTWADPVELLRRAVGQLEPSGYLVSCSLHLGHGDIRLARARGSLGPEDLGVAASSPAVAASEDLDGLRQLLIAGGLILLDVDRVIVPMFQSSLGLRRAEVSAEAVDRLLADPESETMLFVTKAVIDNGSQAVAALAERVQVLSNEVRCAAVRMALVRGQLHEYSSVVEQRDRVEAQLVDVRAQLSEHQKYVEALEGHAAGLEAQVRQLVDEVATSATAMAELDVRYQALQRSRAVRSAQAVRASWARLTRRGRP
jgi:hypothetical protein